MSRKINFAIWGVWSGRYVFEILIDGSIACCKAARISYDNESWQKFCEAQGIVIEVSEAWLKELDALEIFSWEKKYDRPPEYLDADISWRLTFDDNGKIYRGRGTNTAHKNWPQFMDWLGEIFKEGDRWLNI